jgi:predicted alpha/beta-fold hydrolase
MPVIPSNYRAPRLLRNPHLHTVLCSTLRQRPQIPYIRERLELTDGDFVDLDWSTTNSKKLLILTHGMEGSSSSKYILHTILHANQNGYSAVAWNLRGCSGESNRKPGFYHSGKSEDLDAVVKHALARGFREIYLAGFSLGGNLTLVYLGRAAQKLHKAVRAAVAVSAPVDLAASQIEIERPRNRIYLKRFLREFEQKFSKKRNSKGIYIDISGFSKRIKTLAALDARYTAPWNGFADEKVYYAKSSALPVLKDIRIPFLLLNPKDDTFLGKACYPVELAAASKNFFLETPETGGHCAMLENYGFKKSFMEKRILEFFAEHTQMANGVRSEAKSGSVSR